ncbi:hypothetical protein [Leucobacter aridicollis]|uniref:hypothetical protein n=1 Tax=Leucobacter aridicollis TaxID=283878 RepID=UPI002167E496|nr:hypothetical protein [Leucobacter aridicollis]MCS3427593.1 hypothetical protein [Leucobacter aridicollis]
MIKLLPVEPIAVPNEPSVLDVLTAVVAILAFLLSVTALIWSIVAHNLNGHRVKAELAVLVKKPSTGMTLRNTRVAGFWLPRVTPPARVPFCTVHTEVTLRNKGRTAVNVERFVVIAGRKDVRNCWSIVLESDDFPKRLEPGASERYEFHIDDADKQAVRKSKRRYRVGAELGDGKIVASRKSYSVGRTRRGRAFLKSAIGQKLSAAT